MTPEQFEAMEQKVVKQLDGHFCVEWDGLAVSAWTCEYDCCIDFPTTRLGRIINWFVMAKFNFIWWWRFGRHDRY
jgi:hypothetical protein